MQFSSGAEFLASAPKRLAFIGMSGVGKSTLAGYLNPAAWTTYCTDHALADGPLRPELAAFAGADYGCGPDDIAVLSAYVGKLGALPEGEFRKRQNLHRMAERKTFEAVAQRLKEEAQSVIVDAGGSLVEILDFEGGDPLVQDLCDQVLFVYIEADLEHEAEIIARQLQAPKPMYYHEGFLTQAIADFDQPLTPDSADAFIAFVFPRLMAHRRPRYAALAKAGGVTVPLKATNAVRTDAALFALIAEAIDQERLGGQINATFRGAN